jgi:pimeloyl-ACP methyl ester carboxylesterase
MEQESTMPAVFVHGNPESAAIWELLIPLLDRDDVVLLSPPGFGAPTPEGWGAARTEYVDWLVAELESIGEPVDLVGHDWGGGHVAGVALTRPDLLRSWTIDLGGLFHPDYEWHDMAQAWQTPGVGEEVVAGMIGAPLAERTAQYVELGMPEAIAAKVAAAGNEEMGRCILALYRDAAQPVMRNLGRDLSVMRTRPGLVLIAEDDGYVGTETMARDTAERAGAEVCILPGVGHWWMLQNPAIGATALNAFWTSF